MRQAVWRRVWGGAALAAACVLPQSAAAQTANSAQPADAGGEAGKAGPANVQVYRQAQAYRGTKILVSTNERRLRLVAGRDTVMDVAVAIGMNKDFEYDGRSYRFETPTGRRTVQSKGENPVWTPPEWHYMEKAAARGLELVRLQPEDKIALSDGSFIIMIGDQVGRVNQFGNFWPFTPGIEIVFDGRIFMPPFSAAQRRVPDALGPYKLDLGDGYLIHGTHIYNEDSIGQAVSHGCVRMNNDDLERLYELVEPGVPVFIY